VYISLINDKLATRSIKFEAGGGELSRLLKARIEAESQSEGSWLEVSENKGIFFEIKWHMRRNWSDNIVGKRNASGTAFHLSDEYHRTLPEMLGIGYLRKSLSQSLQKDLDIERPDFQKDLHSKHREVGAELEQLSQLCATAQN
jgi:hypothetical protein